MTTVSVCATACFLSASQPVSNAAARACPLSVARRSRSPGGRSLLSTCLRTGLESAAAGGDRAVCLPPAAESLVLRVATQLPALGSAAPQLRAPRAPRRHALAPRAKLQRLARAERRAATSDARASQATPRQPVSCFRSTQVRTVRQMSAIASPAILWLARVLPDARNPRRLRALHPSPARLRSHSRPKDAGGRGRRAHLELLQRLMSKMSVRHATAAPWREAMGFRAVR